MRRLRPRGLIRARLSHLHAGDRRARRAGASSADVRDPLRRARRHRPIDRAARGAGAYGVAMGVELGHAQLHQLDRRPALAAVRRRARRHGQSDGRSVLGRDARRQARRRRLVPQSARSRHRHRPASHVRSGLRHRRARRRDGPIARAEPARLLDRQHRAHALAAADAESDRVGARVGIGDRAASRGAGSGGARDAEQPSGRSRCLVRRQVRSPR